jgi:hypothetical protein
MNKTFILWLMAMVVILSSINCAREESSPDESATTRTDPSLIDRRSYVLGGIGAFAEMVGAGVKKLALSAPMTPEEMDGLIQEAQRIAAENGAEITREEDFLVTDLFPAEITEGKHVLLIAKGSTKQAYYDLKAEKRRLVESGAYVGAAREDIARRMGRLLSYPEERIDELLAQSHGKK